MQNLGYACMNMTLSSRPKKTRVTTNRSMIRRTFDARGIQYASELALQNCIDLRKILDWNEQLGLRFYRLSSNIFPWASEYNLSDLPDYDQIVEVLADCGDFADRHGHRLTSHPGPFNKLTSPKKHVIINTIKDLETHGEIFDLLNLSRTPYNKINIHVGATYGDKPMAVDNFCNNFYLLSDAVRSRLTVENDDKGVLYTVEDLYSMVHSRIGIPIVFDYHHHRLLPGNQTEEEALTMALSTWGNVKPVVHYSESRCEEQGSDCKPQAHSDFIYNYIDDYGNNIDIMVEAKMKELAVLQYHDQQSRKAA